MANIRNIAKLSGVSKATVSRILNQDESFSVSDTTRKRVLETARRLNYIPASNASKDSVERLHLGIVNCVSAEDELKDPYFREIKIGIEEQAELWGMMLFKEIHLPSYDYDLKDLSLCGAVIVIGTLTEAFLANIYHYNHNIIIIDDSRHFLNYDVIHNDFDQQTQNVLDLMKSKGHQKIAFIGGRKNLSDNKSIKHNELLDVREQSYLNWMKLNDLEKYINVQVTQWSTEGAMKAAKKILALDRPTAILTASDPQAIGVYRIIQEFGMSIPKDIAVVSFDDIEMAQYLYPSLTTVKPAAKIMGKEAINLVRERLVDNRKVSLEITVNSNLIIRESL
ncbi:MAG: LacI family DNA-binding transcriptional regulator [Lactobacillus sp.]|uniref:LacI family DNA-binding transcriptional regulator n=1 Tax=Bombilactobacillus bombi TaxID=1303590 RepID=UPI0035EC17F7|nr:LacI family DNA-binding transcriptional regulator [Lactobacillus sp.]